MNKALAIILTALTISAFAKDKAEVTYVGGGRYVCSGDSYQCAQVNANNRAIEDRDRQRWEREKEFDYEQRKRDLEQYRGRR